MTGRLNPSIIEKAKTQFKNDCVKLLLEGYEQLSQKIGISDLTENSITVQLVGLMKKIPLRFSLQISITREAYNDTEEIYEGIVDADQAARIDIKYSRWSGPVEYEFFVECKNLAENNWKRNNSNNIIQSHKLRLRYIHTGIGNFISGRYPQGLLIGYILEGNTNAIVTKINLLLNKLERGAESLSESDCHTSAKLYLSNHTGTSIENLEHYFFKLK